MGEPRLTRISRSFSSCDNIASLPAELCVQLVDESIACRASLLDLRFVIDSWFSGDDLLRSLALLDHRRHAIADYENHVAMRNDRSAINGRAVSGNDLRVRAG